MEKSDYRIQTNVVGDVSWGWARPGHVGPLNESKNQVTYSCADVLANLLAGNANYKPAYIGYIYGSDDNPTLLDPATQRNHTWESIASNLRSVGGNIQINPLTMTPSVAPTDEMYAANSVTFFASTRSGEDAIYGFPHGGDYAEALVAGNYLYHAVLLSLPSKRGTYIPVARVSLKESENYTAKPVDFEMAVQWRITFF